MGLRGPARKAVSDQIRRGNPGKRKLVEQSETHATISDTTLNLLIPQKPDWLSEQASEVWDDLLPKLLIGNVVRSVDSYLLADFCLITAEMQKCQRDISKHGVTRRSKTNTGIQTKTEQFVLLTHLRKEQLKLADALGLSPKSRKALNITLNQPKKPDAAEARKSRILGK